MGEDDFLFVQANDLDKDSMQFHIQNEDTIKSMHWAVSAGHEESHDFKDSERNNSRS